MVSKLYRETSQVAARLGISKSWLLDDSTNSKTSEIFEVP